MRLHTDSNIEIVCSNMWQWQEHKKPLHSLRKKKTCQKLLVFCFTCFLKLEVQFAKDYVLVIIAMKYRLGQ